MAKKKTKEEFIKDARDVHGDKYDYSKVEYIGSKIKVCIICPKHGEFWQKPNCHLSGRGCPKCKGDKTRERLTSTKEEFIKKAKELHNGKYDYSKVDYVNNVTKVCIICPQHGEFWQSPNGHLSGQGCPECKGDKLRERLTSTKEEFIEKSRKKHGDKYDYSNVEYHGALKNVCIICPEHGKFWQKASGHLRGQGCPKCGGNYIPTTEEWIENARNVHGGKYDYSKVKYIDSKSKVCIKCPIHGGFEQTPHNHLGGQGCPTCGKCIPTKEEWIVSARKKHGEKYDYSKVEYVNARTKVCIICPEHGEFWQMSYKHLSGSGCPKCNLSHLERSVMNYLDGVEIDYEHQKHFKWLKQQSLDFYLPDYNVGIECQGEQHFFPVDFAGKGVKWACKMFNKTNSRDKQKKVLCEEHDIKLLYFGNVPNYETFLGEVVHDDVQFLIDYLEEHKINRN